MELPRESKEYKPCISICKLKSYNHLIQFRYILSNNARNHKTNWIILTWDFPPESKRDYLIMFIIIKIKTNF